MQRHCCIALLIAGSFCQSGRALPASWTVRSPDRRIQLTVQLENELHYSVCMGGKEVLGKAPLGVHMEGAKGDFFTHLRYISKRRLAIDERYSLPSGKQSEYRDHANSLSLTVRNDAEQDMIVELRAYNDGIAYRYRFPGAGSRTITSEESAFQVPVGSEGWAANWEYAYEMFYAPGVVGKDFLPGQKDKLYHYSKEHVAPDYTDDISYPALFHAPSGAWVLLTEAAVYGDYSAGRLGGEHRDRGLFRVGLAYNEPVSSTLPWSTPWRVAVIGPSLATVVETTLPENLNPPNEVKDMKWIRPGIATWMWWYPSEADYHEFRDAHQIEFSAFAHEMGWLYSEAGPRIYPALKQWGMQPMSYFDYRLIKDWPISRVEEQMKQWSEKGSHVLKCDFMNSDSQKTMQAYDDIARLAMKYHMVVNWHGASIPRGQRRRWPHMLGYEGVLGAEYYKFTNNPPTPQHNVTLPFTRNAVGPMDYTGVTFSGPASRPRRLTSNAHELALSVLFETGIQYRGDTPDAYRAMPAVLSVFKQIPAAWDETRFVAGYPGRYAVVARRSGTRWFVGGASAEPVHDTEVSFAFLPVGKSFEMQLYEDGADIDHIATAHLTVTRESVVPIHLLDNGGFTAILLPVAGR